MSCRLGVSRQPPFYCSVVLPLHRVRAVFRVAEEVLDRRGVVSGAGRDNTLRDRVIGEGPPIRRHDIGEKTFPYLRYIRCALVGSISPENCCVPLHSAEICWVRSHPCDPSAGRRCS